MILFDGDSLLYKIGYATEGKSDGDAITSLDKRIKNIYTLLNSSRVIIFLNSESNFRKELYDSYKANRTSNKPSNYDILKAFLIDNYCTLSYHGFESDDLLAYHHSLDIPTVIVGEDKDLEQVSGYFYNTRHNYFHYVDEDTAFVNFWSQMVTGDTVDNIKGLVGKGPVFFSNLLEVVQNTYKSYWKTGLITEICRTYTEMGQIDEFIKNYNLLKLVIDPNRYKNQNWITRLKNT